MRKPIIGISGSVLIEQNGMLLGIRRTYVNEAYIMAIEMAGGVPLVLPVVDDEDIIKAHIELVDGLILTGGQDIDPLSYGEEHKPKLTATWPKRDKYDSLLALNAIELNKPILGICRGMQVLNTAFGGTLYQDVSEIGDVLKHVQFTSPDTGTHTVVIKEGSKLYDILGDEVIMNSLHHQSVKDIPAGFKAVAETKDGVIEGIEREGDLFVVGVQFHPELMVQNYDYALNLFKELVEVSKR